MENEKKVLTELQGIYKRITSISGTLGDSRLDEKTVDEPIIDQLFNEIDLINCRINYIVREVNKLI